MLLRWSDFSHLRKCRLFEEKHALLCDFSITNGSRFFFLLFFTVCLPRTMQIEINNASHFMRVLIPVSVDTTTVALHQSLAHPRHYSLFVRSADACASAVYRVATCVGWPAHGGLSHSGRIFMAEKIFYHNNTEIRRTETSSLFSLAREDTGWKWVREGRVLT